MNNASFDAADNFDQIDVGDIPAWETLPSTKVINVIFMGQNDRQDFGSTSPAGHTSSNFSGYKDHLLRIIDAIRADYAAIGVGADRCLFLVCGGHERATEADEVNAQALSLEPETGLVWPRAYEQACAEVASERPGVIAVAMSEVYPGADIQAAGHHDAGSGSAQAHLTQAGYVEWVGRWIDAAMNMEASGPPIISSRNRWRSLRRR